MRTRSLSFIVALVASVSCSGRPEPSGASRPLDSGVAGPTMFRAKDLGLPSPSPSPAVCTIGQGDPDATCLDRGVPELLAEVDTAIDALVLQKPELFDRERVVGTNGYLVLDPAGFYQGVAAILQAKGLCAEWDFEALQVKNSQARSERYDLLLSNDHIRRGAGSFRSTCTPASFPLTPAQAISRVRVAFYSIQCDDGRTPPRNGEDILPVDCTGLVTATPKDKDDADVDKRIHGPEIVWELETDGAEPVEVEDFPNVAFNKFVHGRDPGGFRLCATVQTHKGCLNGTVVLPTPSE
jgi:hypothetical protein